MYKVECALSNDPDRDDPQQRSDAIFTQMDKDCDDNLSLEEFIDGVKKDPHIMKVMDIQ
jgi:Ca2+-binding EF-hand superfamily protein